VTKRLRAGVAVALVALVAAAIALVAGSVQHGSPLAREGSEQQGLAFKQHTQELFSKQGNQEGPLSYADQVYELNAYPDSTISADQIASSQDAGAALASRGVGKGKSSTSSWYSLGPTDAIYPAFLNRHGSQYTTSGRITALAISPSCTPRQCTVWVAAAGGGVWKTDKGLSGNGGWVNVSDGAFASGAIGSLTYDAAHNTLYAGTGEDAAAGDAEAGIGIYKSIDGGSIWSALGGNANFVNRSVRQIAVDPNDATGNTIYVADGRGVHGISSTTAGAVSMIPNAPGVGVWKSTDGGTTFTLEQHSTVSFGALPGQTFESSFGSSRGATDVALDPTHPGVVYATAYNKGVWRSNDNGTTWTNIHPCDTAITTCGTNADRSEFALATVAGHTRMYQTEGDSGPSTLHPERYSRLFVADAVESGAPAFVDKTSSSPASPGYATYNFCTGQCWYDQGVYSPAGHPDMVYVFGSYVYAEDHGISNARGLLLSTDGGNTFTDLTEDATSATAPNGLHPDQHDLVTNPNNPLQFFEGSDGGLMRSDGTLVDTSSRCDSRGLSGDSLTRCKQLLSAVPGALTSLNNGLQTLQFQSLSVNPANPKNVQGGTQDNGTFETSGSSVTWPQTIFGDGGLSGFDATNPDFRVHTYFAQQVDVSFAAGDPPSWDWISDPLFAESALFYFPIITDPVVHGTMYAGLNHVWRTLDSGGPQAYLDQHCNEFTGDFTVQCGDWVPLDGSTLTGSARGTRAGGVITWVARDTSDAGTLWASTQTGRVFISKNADNADPAAVTFTRLDSLATNSPGRAVSSIYVDPANANHAWVSYLGYNDTTPTTPGHVFSVTYDSVAGTATWTSLDGTGTGAIGNLPVNGVATDTNGDVYAATDFGVAKLAGGNVATGWAPAAPGLPVVTVAGLTINPGSRQLLAATHGRGAYQLTLP
jgi:hypothetical protein